MDFGKGWQQIAAPITVTLTRPAGVEDELSVTVPNCHESASRRTTDTDDLTTTAREERTFTLWDSQTALRPRPDFFITKADGSRWRVQEVDVCGHDARYRCRAILTRN